MQREPEGLAVGQTATGGQLSCKLARRAHETSFYDNF